MIGQLVVRFVMIYWLLFLISISLSIVGLLFHRIKAARAELIQVLRQSPRHRFLDALCSCISLSADDSLLATLDGYGFDGCSLRYREAQDSYRSVGELLRYMSQLVRSQGGAPLEALVKATYQLAYTLDVPLDQLNECLEILIEQMHAKSSRPIARVQKIFPGDLVDSRTMVPLDYGQRVRYPLGLITYDAENNVISPGRVICS